VTEQFVFYWCVQWKVEVNGESVLVFQPKLLFMLIWGD
jgi:hypothetical protein